METSEQITKVLDALCNKVGIAIDWQTQNIMPYLQELCDRYTRYEIITSIITIAICSAIIILLMISLIKILKGVNWDNGKEDDFSILSISVSGLILIFLLIEIFTIYDIVEYLTIPEKAFAEYIIATLRQYR